MDQRERAERATYKRLVISFHDLQDSRAYLSRLLGLNGQPRVPDSDRVLRGALETALIVSYARPFSGNRAADDVLKDLPGSFLRGLSPEQAQAHEMLLKLRHEEFAHSDPAPAEVKVWVTEPVPGLLMASPVSSVTRVPLQEDILVQAQALQEHLYACIHDEMIRLQARFRPGESF